MSIDLTTWTMAELRETLDDVTEARKDLRKRIRRLGPHRDDEKEMDCMDDWAQKIMDEILRRQPK